MHINSIHTTFLCQVYYYYFIFYIVILEVRKLKFADTKTQFADTYPKNTRCSLDSNLEVEFKDLFLFF